MNGDNAMIQQCSYGRKIHIPKAPEISPLERARIAATESREAKTFANDDVSPNVGVVVFSNFDNRDEIAMVVADFSRHHYVYALSQCFQPRGNPLTRSQFYKDETPYAALENVQYECNVHNIITAKVTRYTKKYEVHRSDKTNMAVKCKCVIGDAGQCYTDIAGLVPCDEEVVRKNITRNIPFECWLGFELFSGLSLNRLGSQRPKPLKYKLESLVVVDPENFEFAQQAPWFPRKATAPLFQDEFELALQKKMEIDCEPLALIRGYFIYQNIVYIPTLPFFKVRLVWKKFSKVIDFEKKLEYLEPLEIDIKYNPVLQFHVVYNASPDDSRTKIRGVVNLDSVDRQEYLNVSVKPLYREIQDIVVRCPGYFEFTDGSGIVYDYYGVMLRRYDGTDVIDNVQVRYCNPDPYSSTPLYVYSSEVDYWEPGGMIGFDADALCIAPGEFYCPHFHSFSLKTLPDANAPAPGDLCKIMLDSYDSKTNTFYVSWQAIPRYSRVRTKKIGNTYQFLMHLDIIRGPTVVFSHEVIGVVGYNYKLVQMLKIPPYRAFAIATVQFKPTARNEHSDYQSRGYVINTFAQDDAVMGFK